MTFMIFKREEENANVKKSEREESENRTVHGGCISMQIKNGGEHEERERARTTGTSTAVSLVALCR